MKSAFSTVLHYIIHLILPPICPCCKREGRILCEKCYQLVQFNLQPVHTNLVCSEHLDEVKTLAIYQPPVSNLIRELKYHRVKLVAKQLAELLFLHLSLPTADLITGAPISRKRLSQRGFNQAQLIADRLAELARLPSPEIITKHKDTKKQARSSFEERQANLTDSLLVEASQQPLIRRKSILLIDDVISTGATLNECARVLKKAGAKQVFGVGIAQSL